LAGWISRAVNLIALAIGDAFGVASAALRGKTRIRRRFNQRPVLEELARRVDTTALASDPRDDQLAFHAPVTVSDAVLRAAGNRARPCAA